MFFLRQATSTTVLLGPFTDTSGVFVNSLGTTLTNSTLMLFKNGAAAVARNVTNTASQRVLASGASTGMYSVQFDNTDTGSLGRLVASTTSLNCLPVWHEYTVMPANEFDYMITGSSGVWDIQRAAMFGVAMSSVSVIAARSPINALRTLRNRITTSGGIMTIYDENDSTAVWTATLTTNASADPIVESDPS